MKKGLKQKSVAKPVAKVATIWDTMPKNEVERLELMIRMTEKHVVPGRKDDMMAAQAVRLRAQLEELKKSSS